MTTERSASLDLWTKLRETLAGAGDAASLAVHARVQREVADLVARGLLPPFVRPLRVAIVRAVTVEPVVPSLVAAMAAHDLAATVVVGQLGNVADEIMSVGSFLYTGNFDVCIVLAPLESLLPGYGDPGAAMDGLDERLRFHLECLRTLLSRFPGLVVACNFAPPEHLLAPLLQARTAASTRYAAARANHLLAAWAEGEKRVVVGDVERAAWRLGASRFYAARNLFLAQQPYSPEGFLALAEDWSRLCRLHVSGPPKCIMVDCDNTLWGGIVGEDGVNGIKVGETYPGVCYQQFQRQLRQLRELGFLLAICSRNDEADVRAAFAQHPGMVLRLADFAAVRVNWLDKAANIASIAEELSLGVDSFVFVDDSPFEIASVRAAHPGVRCLQVPSETWRLPALLPSAAGLDRLAVTSEDRGKSAMYAQERERAAARERAASPEDHLRQLGLAMTVERFAWDRHLERAVQLLQKTNQFNLTTRRHSEADLRALLDAGARVYLASLADAFGDYGRVALAIVVADADGTPSLDTLLMSCRAIGRRAESAFLAVIAQALRRQGHRRLRARFVPTAKNGVCAGFLAGHGFARAAARPGDEGEPFEAALADIPAEALAFYRIDDHSRGAGHE